MCVCEGWGWGGGRGGGGSKKGVSGGWDSKKGYRVGGIRNYDEFHVKTKHLVMMTFYARQTKIRKRLTSRLSKSTIEVQHG